MRRGGHSPQRDRGRSIPGGNVASTVPALMLMLEWLAVLMGSVWSDRLPPSVLRAAVAVNSVTFFAYALDKKSA